MARIRSIKPDFFTNEELAELSPLARLMFIGLWTVADREGRLEDRPRRLKVAILPYDQVDPDALLAELAGRGFIIRYAVEGRQLIQIPTFTKHQVFNVKEASSSIPGPTLEQCKHSTSTVLVPVEHGSRARKGEGGGGREGKRDEPTALVAKRPEAAASPPPDAVLEFPTRGKAKLWWLTSQQLNEFRGVFPGLDVFDQFQRARLWVLAKPERQKTARGMLAFLGHWLGKAANEQSGRNGNGSSPHVAALVRENAALASRAPRYDPDDPDDDIDTWKSLDDEKREAEAGLKDGA